jgi:hypothetical protein
MFILTNNDMVRAHSQMSELSKIGFDRLLPVMGSPIRNEITITNNQRVLVATAAGIRLKSA